ncbi:hypothetical protein B0T14DRAFT_597034 [Immersiella caudata]|uniref:Apple domain-containing protein n=1 Tax=Immersiella caudata TaxID=314043 RepID=A0AA40CAP0_9PEZI|nr:hypothetical protein B0T14DRAFT_597034 [Immersiella caudata]
MSWACKILATFCTYLSFNCSTVQANNLNTIATTPTLSAREPLRTFPPDCTLSDFRIHTTPAGQNYLVGCFVAGPWGGRHDVAVMSWQNTPEDCAKHCDTFPQCKGFTYSRFPGPWENCWVYDELPEPQMTKQSGYGGVALDSFLLAYAWGGELPTVEGKGGVRRRGEGEVSLS